MGRSKFKGNGDKRDGHRFLALPDVVLESPGYRQAGYPARALLIDIAMQYTGHNNGKLTACAKYLKPKGWTGNNTVVRALRELQACGLLIETRKGARPNRAAWFALSWADLDQGTGLDIDPKYFHRGAYRAPDKATTGTNTASRTAKATAARRASALKKRSDLENASLTPFNGAARLPVAPSDDQTTTTLASSDGAMRATLASATTPTDGAYLETPSALLRTKRSEFQHHCQSAGAACSPPDGTPGGVLSL
jgi:hypothetical protein